MCELAHILWHGQSGWPGHGETRPVKSLRGNLYEDGDSGSLAGERVIDKQRISRGDAGSYGECRRERHDQRRDIYADPSAADGNGGDRFVPADTKDDYRAG